MTSSIPGFSARSSSRGSRPSAKASRASSCASASLTGRALQSQTAKHRRYALRERQLSGGVEDAFDFAERFYLHAEATLGLSLARHLLVLGDGADWIEVLTGDTDQRLGVWSKRRLLIISIGYNADDQMLGGAHARQTRAATGPLRGGQPIPRRGGQGELLRLPGQPAGVLFRDEEFAHLYKENNGRPSVPPSLLATALLLQTYDRVSNEEAKERADFDLRWKVALGITIEAHPFAKSTLQLFRAQLVANDEARRVFTKRPSAGKAAGTSGEEPEAAAGPGYDEHPRAGSGEGYLQPARRWTSRRCLILVVPPVF